MAPYYVFTTAYENHLFGGHWIAKIIVVWTDEKEIISSTMDGIY